MQMRQVAKWSASLQIEEYLKQGISDCCGFVASNPGAGAIQIKSP